MHWIVDFIRTFTTVINNLHTHIKFERRKTNSVRVTELTVCQLNTGSMVQIPLLFIFSVDYCVWYVQDTHHTIPSQHGTFCVKHIILQEFMNLRHSTVVKFRSMRLDTALSLKLAQS